MNVVFNVKHAVSVVQMVAKKTPKNQITLPKVVLDLFPDATYFDVRAKESRIVLMPLPPAVPTRCGRN